MADIFTELKRRNVFRVAVVYGVVTWILIQVADVVFPAIGLPEWSITLIIAFLAIGFPIALIFAWAFEITPEGIKKEKDVDRSQSITPQTGRKLDFAIFGLMAAALIYFAADKFWLRTSGESAGTETVAESTAPSIAVLPFASMSSDPENEHFSDGLSEELLNMLAHIKELKVAGRTSSFYFKGRNEDLTEIGEKLGVNHVLEGSVRKAGDRVRITAQLIAVNDGFHLWSETYDRQLDDIFAIQEDIARAVADAMKITLLGEEDVELSKRSTDSGEAHSVYLIARNRMRERGLENLRQARKLFERAVEIDPEFAPAWSGLADTVMLLHANHFDIGYEEMNETASGAVDRALAMDPGLAEGWTSQGQLYNQRYGQYGDDADLQAALDAYRRGIELNDKYAEAWHWLGLVMGGSLYDLEGALKQLDRALELDPLARNPQYMYADYLQTLGRNAEARQRFMDLIDLYPDYQDAYEGLSLLEENAGRLDQAIRWNRRALEADTDPGTVFRLATLHAALNNHDTFRELLESLLSHERFGWLVSAFLADDDQTALALVEQARGQVEETFWANAAAWMAVYAGEFDKAERYAAIEFPDLISGGAAAVNRSNADTAILLAYVQQQTGRAEEARAILETVLDARKRPEAFHPRGFQRLQRVIVLAMLGRVDQALDELRAAVDSGYRNVYRTGVGFGRLPIDEDPLLGNLHGEPRFIAMLQEIDADNARARRRLESGEVPIL